MRPLASSPDRSPPGTRAFLALVLAGHTVAVLALAAALGRWGWPPAVAAIALVLGAVALRRPLHRTHAVAVTVGAIVAMVATEMALHPHPVVWLGAMFTMSLLPQLQRPLLVVAAGVLLAAAPFVAPWLAATPPSWSATELGVYLGLLAALTTLLGWIARRHAEQARERFDMVFLVGAMGQEGAIRLGFEAVRAESALGERLKDVQQRMLVALRQVRAAVDDVRAASSELGGSGDELRERTERSASGLREAAMTLEQINVIVQGSAQAALEARTMASDASVQAEHGGALFEQVTARMRDIDAASRRITDVIAVIDGIAFQTNILALNAAVEAARAGELGRGFAVVAAEVRSLALRASTAAAEVKRLIGNSIETVNSGNALVSEAAGSMQRIVESVRKVGAVFETLSADTREHAGSIDAVTRAMRELDEVTRQNVSVVETAGRVAGALKAQGDQLEQVLGAFKLGAREPTAADGLTLAADAVASAPASPQAPPSVRAVRTPPGPATTAPVAVAPTSSNVEFF